MIPGRFVNPFFKTISAILLAGELAEPGLMAADWPQFRGPARDGTWTEIDGILDKFPKTGLKFEWKRPVGGGFASPVVADGRVFVIDVDLVKPAPRERLHCFAEKSGKVLWVYAYKEKYAEWTFVPERGSGPTATPIVDGERVYALGAYGFLHCFDVKTGAVLWEKNIGKEYEVVEGSCRPSPLIEKDLLIVFTGAKPKASVMALDKRTGREVWKALDDTVSNSSPIVIAAAGHRQLIVWSAQALTSLDPFSGEVYWREPMSTSGNDSAATPLFVRGRLLVSGLMMDVINDPPTVNFLWPTNRAPSKRLLSNTSTPVRLGDYIYSARGMGELVCLDADFGRELWSTNTITAPKNGASINITPNGSTCFLFTDEGNLIHAELSPNGYREISRAHLIDPTWPFNEHKFVYAPPAFANGRVFARNEGEVVCASLKAVR